MFSAISELKTKIELKDREHASKSTTASEMLETARRESEVVPTLCPGFNLLSVAGAEGSICSFAKRP